MPVYSACSVLQNLRFVIPCEGLKLCHTNVARYLTFEKPEDAYVAIQARDVFGCVCVCEWVSFFIQSHISSCANDRAAGHLTCAEFGTEPGCYPYWARSFTALLLYSCNKPVIMSQSVAIAFIVRQWTDLLWTATCSEQTSEPPSAPKSRSR